MLWHATGPIPSGCAICILPLCILCAGARIYFRSRNGTKKEQKECVGWGAGPCLLVSILAGAAEGAAQGLSCHSQHGSFLLGNTWEFPVHPTGSGPPVHGPHRAETQHWLCKSDTFIFFFKSPLPNRSILWRGWAVATTLWDSPTELYNPWPSPQLSPGSVTAMASSGCMSCQPPLPVGAAPCQGQAAWLLQVSISALHFPAQL